MTAETTIQQTDAIGGTALGGGAELGDTKQSGGGLLGDSARIAAASALSRLTGLLRIIVAASVLGATVFGDLFVAINVLPLTLYDVFAGSAISAVLVPPLVKLLDRRDGNGARRFAANSLGIICAAMAALAIGAILARPLLARALTAGVDRTLAQDAADVGSVLLLLILPQLVLYAAIGVFVSVQHAHRKFLLPSAAPIIENLGLLATIAVAWSRYGSGIEVDDAPIGLILTLAIGSGLSVTAHALVQFVGARQAIGRIGFGLDIGDPAMRRLAGPARSSFGWSTIIAVRQFALVVAAGFAGAGGVQAFEVATLAYFIPVALIGRPIASAALPRLASAGRDTTSLLRGYLAALRVAAWIAVPAGLSLAVLSGPFAAVIAQGKFDNPDARAMLAYGLIGLGIGAAGDALFEVARQATMAMDVEAGAGLVRSTWLRAIVAVVGIPTVTVLVDGPIVLLALGLVVSVGDVVALAVAHRALRTRNDWPADTGRSHWPRIVVAAVVATSIPALIAESVGLSWHPAEVAGLSLAVLGCYVATALAVTDRGRLLRSLATTVQNTNKVQNSEEPS